MSDIQKSLHFKIATDHWEFDQIHRLNYQTFVNEIPQHDQNNAGLLVDKFHSENIYIICLQNKKLLGMLAVRSQRPFSLDSKICQLDRYLPDVQSVCEIRLLAVVSQYRHSSVFLGLLQAVIQFVKIKRYDLAVISGTTRQLNLYQHIGFQSFGPLVGSLGALYQPMYITLVNVHKYQSIKAIPGSHRSAQFGYDLQELRLELTGSGKLRCL